MWYSSGKDTDIALWILLTTTALVAFAGAAAAEGHSANDGVSFSGDATLGYNDTINAAAGETAAGMYWDASATYEAGAVSATVFTDESDDWGLEGSYAMGNGLTVYAGLVDAGEDYYVAGSYDLGGDATLLVSYVEDGDLDNGDDEIGDPEYQAGMTVEIGFTF